RSTRYADLPSEKKLMSCVRPGVLLTKARRVRPVSALMALDFPALLRPANASSGTPGGGSSRGSCTESAYAACARASEGPARLAGAPRATLESESFRLRGSRMRVFTALAGLMAVVYATATGAAPAEIPKPDLERGKQLATTVCAACHGANGVSPTSAQPNLAGQNAGYIAG